MLSKKDIAGYQKNCEIPLRSDDIPIYAHNHKKIKLIETGTAITKSVCEVFMAIPS
jgi:hypothetical protein